MRGAVCAVWGVRGMGAGAEGLAGAMARAGPSLASALSCRILEKQAQAHGSALFPALKGHDALGHQEEVPAAPVA